jgi:hypothetical protein
MNTDEDIIITEEDLDDWFDDLDGDELANLFPGEFEHTMMSADPNDNINTFYNEVREDWQSMSKEDKEALYQEYKENYQ